MKQVITLVVTTTLVLWCSGTLAQTSQEQRPRRRELSTFAAEVAALEATNPSVHAQWLPVLKRLQARRQVAWMVFGAGVGASTALLETGSEEGDPAQCHGLIHSGDIEAARECLDDTGATRSAYATASAVTFVATSAVALAVNPWRYQVRRQRERFLRGGGGLSPQQWVG